MDIYCESNALVFGGIPYLAVMFSVYLASIRIAYFVWNCNQRSRIWKGMFYSVQSADPLHKYINQSDASILAFLQHAAILKRVCREKT